MSTSAPPGGRGAPGGEAPPGGRSAPGGRPPRLNIGRSGGGRSTRFRMPGGGVGQPGKTYTTKTTIRGGTPPLTREELRAEFGKQLHKERPDITPSTPQGTPGTPKATPVTPPPVTPTAPAGGMGQASPAHKQQTKTARANQGKAVKAQRLGPPGKKVNTKVNTKLGAMKGYGAAINAGSGAPVQGAPENDDEKRARLDREIELARKQVAAFKSMGATDTDVEGYEDFLHDLESQRAKMGGTP
jgi:hypothetical protein